MPLIVLSIIVQLALVVHIIKTGRPLTWVFIVLFFPLIGSLAYFIVELLPEFRSSRTARSLERNISKTVNPHKNLKVASQNLEVADTVQNAIVLANECLERSRFAEAKELFARHLKGVHADDPVLLLGLARASFGLGEFQETIRALDLLKEKNPSARSAEGHLLYARALEQLGQVDAAMHEYEVLRSYFSGPEPTCRLALILKSRGETQRALELFQKIVKESNIAGKHYNNLHKEWVTIARREAAI